MMLSPGSALKDSRRALVVARDSQLRRYLLEALSRVGYPSVPCGQEFDSVLEHGRLDRHAFIIMDEKAGDSKRIDVVRELRERGSKIPVILLRGGPEGEPAASGAGLSPLEFLSKPFTLRSLAGAIAQACGAGRPASRRHRPDGAGEDGAGKRSARG